MPSLFRRKTDDAAPAAEAAEQASTPAVHRKGYTPSKKELGQVTPKRSSNQRRSAEPAPQNRREAYKKMRERQREERAEAQAGMRAGDERYLLARDRGPERLLVRNIVDSRRTAGTYFFAGAFIVLIGMLDFMPAFVQAGSTALWAVLAIAVVVDSVLINRRVRKLVRERFPDTTQKLGGLAFYGIMRGLSFRRMRVPKPMVELGDKV